MIHKIFPYSPSSDAWDQLRSLNALCFPERKGPHPHDWFIAYPTLVAYDGNRLVGYTSFSIALGTGTHTMYGMETAIHPEYRGKGIARDLHDERVRIGKAVGAVTFIGPTKPENVAMIRMLTSCGYHQCQVVPKYYTDEDPAKDAVVFVGSL